MIPHHKEPCSKCGKTKAVRCRLPDGSAICDYCRSMETAMLCSRCGKIKPNHGKDENGKPLCDDCRRKLYPEPCQMCGTVRPVRKRDANGKPLCNRCAVNSDPHLLFVRYRIAAKRAGRVFDLSEGVFTTLVNDRCHYCGEDDSSRLRGIDRVDSNDGYVEDNCVSCCWLCNLMKRDFGYDEFVLRCQKIAERLQPRKPASRT